MTTEANRPHGLHALWDELADYDATQWQEARTRLLAGIAELIDAAGASWIGAVRLDDPRPEDPVKGWRPRAIRPLHPEPRYEQACKAAAQALDAGSVDATTLRNVSLAGRFRVNRLVELAPPDWFEGSFYRDFYLGHGRLDAIWAGIPVNEDTEVYYGFHRSTRQARFGVAERELVAAALRPLKWLHRRLLLAEGIGAARSPLSAAERRVLQGLLQGLPEKAIARRLEINPHTAHVYVKRIFRKYGVTSRSQLMALWLGR